MKMFSVIFMIGSLVLIGADGMCSSQRHQPEWKEFANELTARGFATDMASLNEIALKNPDPHVRWRSVEVLALRDGTAATEVLVDALDDESKVVQDTAATELARLGDERGLKALREFFDIASNKDRKLSLAARLAEFGDCRGFQVAKEATNSTDADMRFQSVAALSHLLGRGCDEVSYLKVVSLLDQLASDPEKRTRREVVIQAGLAVSRGVDTEKLRPLIERIEREDEDPEIRELAKGTLLFWKMMRAEEEGDV